MNNHNDHKFKFGEAANFPRREWIWWIFSLYYFIPVFYMPFSWSSYSLVFGAYAAFIVLCAICISCQQSRVWLPVSALLLLGIATSFLTSGAATFFTYAGFFIGFSFKTPRTIIWLGVTLAIIAGLHVYHGYPIPYFLLPAFTGAATITMLGIMERLRFENKMRVEQNHLEIRQLAVIAERERIARDLHDLLGHTLSSIALKAELAEKLLSQENYTEGRQHLCELNKIARDSLSLVRQTVSGYKHRGLADEVNQLCEKLRQNNFRVQLYGTFPSLSARTETAVILALTELTTNVLRHSNGKQCELRFEQSCGNIMISLSDDGATDSIIEGNGLQGIRERLNALSGTLMAKTGKGTCFTIRLPLPASRDFASIDNSL